MFDPWNRLYNPKVVGHLLLMHLVHPLYYGGEQGCSAKKRGVGTPFPLDYTPDLG